MAGKPEWKSFALNIQNIVYSNERAVLIKMPNSSNYKGYEFWHPAKLVRRGNNSFAATISYTDEFKFKLQKKSNSRHEKFKVLDEVTISAAEMEEEMEVMSDSTQGKKHEDGYVDIQEPEFRKPESVDVAPELRL